MVYPFVTRSLTQTVDRQIHREVRATAPLKYWVFKLSSYLERLGFAIGVVSFLVYYFSYSAARTAGQLDSTEFAQIVDILAKVVVAGVSVSVTGALLQSILFQELESLAEQTLSRIVAERSEKK